MEKSEFEFTFLYFKVYYCGSESHKQPIPYHTQIHCLYRNNIHSFISRTPWLPVHSWKDRTRIPPWQPICCRIQNHDLPLPLSRHSLLWVLYLRTIKTVRETVNHNCCHVCRRVKKSEFEFTFLYFKVYYQKSTPLAILLTIEFLINIRSQNLTYSLYLSLMTLRTSLTSVASNVELCQELPLWSILLWDLEEV